VNQEPLKGDEYWDMVKRVADNVDSWPDWKKGESLREAVERERQRQIVSEIQEHIPAFHKVRQILLKHRCRGKSMLVGWEITL
jgi:hypothetical protein